MKTLWQRLVSFLRLPLVWLIPPEINEDKTGFGGLFGFMSNVNAYVATVSRVTTAGTDSALTAAQAVAGALILAAGASGSFTLTLPSTASIITALGPTVLLDGTFSKLVWIKNDGVGQTGTLTAGDGSTTITGTATIATNTTRLFLLTVTAATTVAFENMGSVSL